MVRRSTPQAKTDELAYPIRIKYRVPGNGLRGLTAPIHAWLDEHVGRCRSAVHSAQAIGSDAIGVYFVRVADAVRFEAAFPQLELANGTIDTWYYSPHQRAVTKEDQPMDAAMMIASAGAIADRLRRSLDNPKTEHVILTREEAVLALGLVDGLREVLQREAGG